MMTSPGTFGPHLKRWLDSKKEIIIMISISHWGLYPASYDDWKAWRKAGQPVDLP